MSKFSLDKISLKLSSVQDKVTQFQLSSSTDFDSGIN